MVIAKQAFIQEVGDWLSQFQWDYYGTLTFRLNKGTEAARRAVRGFIDGLDQYAMYVMVAEWHKYRASTHVHLLARGLQGMNCFLLMNLWHKRHGIARIYPYDSAKGATYYLAKDIQQEAAELDVENMRLS